MASAASKLMPDVPLVIKRAEKEKAKVIKLPASLITQAGKMGGYDKIALLRKGITKAQLVRFKNETGLDYETLATILGVTKATLHAKQSAASFNSNVSERLLKLADLYAFAYETMEDKEWFHQWLMHPIRALGWTAPVEWLDSIYGIGEIRDLVGRIAWGVLS